MRSSRTWISRAAAPAAPAGLLALVCAALPASGCHKTCHAQSECSFGSYCQVDPGSSTGTCNQDCVSNSDCPPPMSGFSTPVCNNQGRCELVDRPPRLTVFEPEDGAHYPDGTRSIRVSGQVQTAADKVTVTVTARSESGCVGGVPLTALLINPKPGTFATLPFVIDDLTADSGKALVAVDAKAATADNATTVEVELDCPGCAQVNLETPSGLTSAPGLTLPTLAGSVMPGTVQLASWRVYSSYGDIMDGALPVSGGAFSLLDVPIFAGLNRLQVVVTGVGMGLGESRCSALVASGVAQETGLRLVLLGDDPLADLELHVIGPDGHFGDPAAELSIRSQNPSFGGTITQGASGAEVAQIEMLPDGVYGVIVEPVLDGPQQTTNTILHPLFNGRTVTAGPVGPRSLTALDGNIWVAGTIDVKAGGASWRTIDQLVEAGAAPTTRPAAWPQFN